MTSYPRPRATMGLLALYERHVLPRCIDRVMARPLFARERPLCVGAATGRVLELGFGSGHNLAHYSRGVAEVLALDPSALALRLAHERVAAAPFPVRVLDAEGGRLPLADGAVDCVVSTWTLCSIPDLPAALAEVRRVLAPGGRFRFLEHGLSPDPRVARWQRRLNGLQKRLAGGCHLDRPIDALVRAAGFELEALERYYMDAPRFAAHTFRGVARVARGA